MITIHYGYLILVLAIFISTLLFLCFKLRKVVFIFKNYRTKKNEEMKEIVDKILQGSEDTLNLFFKFESGMVENIRLSRIIKDMGFKSEHLHAEIIKLLEYIKVNNHE